MTQPQFNSLRIGQPIVAYGQRAVVVAVYFQGAKLETKIDVVTTFENEPVIIPGLTYEAIA